MTRSESLFQSAQRLIPGGVNSPVRAFRGVGGTPFFVARAAGARIEDVDGRSYIDFLGSWGPLILGHAAPAVVEALSEAARRGTSYGAPTGAEVEMAELITQAVPSMEMVRLVSSGTEAAMSAIRLARGATGRDLVVKFDGCYHGHADSLLVKAGSGGVTFGVPDSRGVPAALAALTMALPFNDLGAASRLMAERGHEVAVVVVEPVAGNMGVVPPAPGYLQGLRELCTRHGALLLFDEVITGFRVGPSGAQGRFGITPDLSIFGKVVGGGLPLAAVGGPATLMDELAPLGPVYQAGTLSGNPLATAAGLAVLAELDAGAFDELERTAARLADGLAQVFADAGVSALVPRAFTLVGSFFSLDAVTDYDDAKRADGERYATYFHAMLERGIYLAPSPFETLFPSLAHDDDVLDRTLSAAADAAALLV
jgi:glutamate-1-semialdehyde 2,1-aminomutase